MKIVKHACDTNMIIYKKNQNFSKTFTFADTAHPGSCAPGSQNSDPIMHLKNIQHVFKTYSLHTSKKFITFKKGTNISNISHSLEKKYSVQICSSCFNSNHRVLKNVHGVF